MSDSLASDPEWLAEQGQEALRTLAQMKTSVLGALIWTVGHSLGGRASKETGKLTASDRLAKMGAGLTASEVLESGGSIVGDIADVAGDATGLALISEGATGVTVKQALELPSPGELPPWFIDPFGTIREGLQRLRS